ncbi:hypothetical protein [Roseibium sp.]|uniref:hypothetical protein n=1 Tax=Roseibium sp. TaxID=1936156 RepID=UPI003B52AE4C
MIHPEAVTDPYCGPLHRSFLLGCFFSGAIALLVLPLHLALAGAPPAAAVLMITWMLSQWPLALYLSRSGNLERAITLSAGLFAVFTAAICALTGGASSFAVIWLLIPCLEAAFASRRRTAMVVTGFCGVLYLSLLAFSGSFSSMMGVLSSVEPVAVLGALIYAGTLVVRLIGDRQRSRILHRVSLDDFQTLNQTLSGIVCKVQTSGEVRLLAGPARQLFGAAFASAGPDWIFARLHVTDRPLYLTRLSEARHKGLVSNLEVLIRTCPEDGEEPNGIQYSKMAVRLAPLGDLGRGSQCKAEGRSVLIALDPIKDADQILPTNAADVARISAGNELQPAEDAWQPETLMKSA